MIYPSWPELALLMALVLVAFTYVMAVSGHFPAKSRLAHMATGMNTAILWVTMVLIAASIILACIFTYQMLPSYAAIIGAGLMVLIAPFVLQPFPDRFVDGPAVLIMLTVLALVLDLVMWRMMT